MEEPCVCRAVKRNGPIAALLFSTSSLDVEWQGKLESVSKEETTDKTVPVWGDEEENNNQEDDGSNGVGNGGYHDQEDSKIAPPKHETRERRLSGDEMQYLRDENTTLTHRLAHLESQHAQRVEKLEAKLLHAIETHKQIEERLRSQLHSVLQEQQAAVENARKVRTILTRVSSWMRHVQRATQSERASLHSAHHGTRDLELRVTPRTESPYILWCNGASLATNVPECEIYPTASTKFTLNQDSVLDSYGVLIDSNVNPLPPPAPGRNRTKSLPGKSFNYVGYNVRSPCTRSEEVVALGEKDVVLDEMPSLGAAPRRDTPVPKRSAGRLLAYCAHVVTTSLAGVRSSPSPHQKVTPAWKLDCLSPVCEEVVDEEIGQCNGRSANQRQALNVALPNLSIGLL